MRALGTQTDFRGCGHLGSCASRLVAEPVRVLVLNVSSYAPQSLSDRLLARPSLATKELSSRDTNSTSCDWSTVFLTEFELHALHSDVRHHLALPQKEAWPTLREASSHELLLVTTHTET